MPECWYRAATFPDMEAAGRVYNMIETYLTGDAYQKQRPSDVAAFRFVGMGTDGHAPSVAVITDREDRLQPLQIELLAKLLEQDGGTSYELDEGLLSVLFREWQDKHDAGPQPPSTEHNRNEVVVYESPSSEQAS